MPEPHQSALELGKSTSEGFQCPAERLSFKTGYRKAPDPVPAKPGRADPRRLRTRTLWSNGAGSRSGERPEINSCVGARVVLPPPVGSSECTMCAGAGFLCSVADFDICFRNSAGKNEGFCTRSRHPTPGQMVWSTRTLPGFLMVPATVMRESSCHNRV